MSTYWGYVCRSHDPEIRSDHWLNHGDDALIDLYHKVRSGTWPTASELVPQFGLAYEGELAPMTVVPADGQRSSYAIPTEPRQGGGTPPWSGPLNFLQQHPHCDVALHNEYGEYREISGIAPVQRWMVIVNEVAYTPTDAYGPYTTEKQANEAAVKFWAEGLGAHVVPLKAPQ